MPDREQNQELVRYWRSLSAEEKDALVARAKTTRGTLSNVVHGHQKAGRKLIKRLIEADDQLYPGMFL